MRMAIRRGARADARVTAATALVAVVGTLALAGCTGSGGHAAPTRTGPTAARTQVGPDPHASPPPSFTGTRHALPSGPALANEPDLYKEAALTRCSATPTGWAGAGTFRNTTDHAITVAVVVLFTDAQARDIDSATATVDVAAGETGEWTASRDFDAPEGTRCVLRAVRAD
jgi:hypothetical protein